MDHYKKARKNSNHEFFLVSLCCDDRFLYWVYLSSWLLNTLNCSFAVQQLFT